MKTAFNLIPAAEITGDMHLLIEAGWYGVSFVWYKKDPLSLEGILSYNFNDRITAAEVGSNLEYIVGKKELLKGAFSSVSVFYNFRESLLVPGKFFNDASSMEQLAVVYGSLPDNIIRTDLINFDTGIGTSGKIHNIYRVPEAIHTMITTNFPGSKIMHSTSMQVNNIVAADIHCIVFHNAFKVILFNKGRLQLVQQFSYKTPEDVVYHLLNVCDKHHINVSEGVLMLCGMIDAQSNLYHELYKYFLNISFVTVSDEVFLASDIKAFPSHFFSHLTALAQCVS